MFCSQTANLLMQPGPREGPDTVSSPGRDAQELGGVGVGKTHEIPQMDKFHRLGIHDLQPIQGRVEGHQIFVDLWRGDGHVRQLIPGQISAPFDAILAAGVLDQYPPHGLGCGGEEVTPIVPRLLTVPAHESQVGFVDQCRRLERLPRLFVRQPGSRQFPQFVIDQRQQLLRRRRIAVFNRREDSGDFTHFGIVAQTRPPFHWQTRSQSVRQGFVQQLFQLLTGGPTMGGLNETVRIPPTCVQHFMRFRPRGTPRFGRRRDQWRVVMLAGGLVIVIFSIFKSADPRHWAWLNEPQKQQRPMTPRDEKRIKRLQEQLTEKALGQTDNVVAGKPNAPQAAPAGGKPNADQNKPGPHADPAEDLRIPKAVFAEINENSLFIRRAEGPAYWKVLAKVRDVPQADLEQAALQDVTYTQLFSDPDAYRGRLVSLEGELLQLNRLPQHDNDAQIGTVYEGWLRNADSGKNPYVFHCLDKPAGLKEGMKLNEKVRISGYFFKRYQYPAQSGLTYAAPMLLAKRIQWFPVVQRKAAADPKWIPMLLGGIALVGISLGGSICWFIIRDQRRSNMQLKRFTAPTITDFGQIELPPD